MATKLVLTPETRLIRSLSRGERPPAGLPRSLGIRADVVSSILHCRDKSRVAGPAGRSTMYCLVGMRLVRTDDSTTSLARGITASGEMPMKSKKQRVEHWNEILMRSIEVSSLEASISIHAHARRGYKPAIETTPSLEVGGLMDEPVRDVRSVLIRLRVDDRTEPGPVRPASVGAIIETRPHLFLIVGFPQADFDRVWSLALLGHLKFAHIVFTKPYRNSGLVVSVSFSTKPEE